MTDTLIMKLQHDDLVRLFLLRRDDLKAASKEAARLKQKEQKRILNKKRLSDENYRKLHNERNRKYRESHKEQFREYQKSWFEKNREKNAQRCKEYRRRKALRNEEADVTPIVAEVRTHPVIKPELLRIHKTVKPQKKEPGVRPFPDFELTEIRTDKEAAAYWQTVIDSLEYRFFAKEIDVETYFNERNIAASHMIAAENRMKRYRN